MPQQNFGSVVAGEKQTATLTFTFTSSSFDAESVAFNGSMASYVTALNLPMTYYGGSGEITVEINLPAGTPTGSYTLSVTLTGLDAYGTSHQASGQASFTVTSSESPGISIPSGTVSFIVVVAVLACVVVGSLAVLTRRH